MSTTTDLPGSSGAAAALIADALLAEANRSTDHRRMYLAGAWGVPLEDVFDSLAARMLPTSALEVATARGPLLLDSVPLSVASHPGGRLVPYLVGPASARNRGSGGFAAVLRDQVPAGPGLNVLLVMDRQPLETVRTAAEDAASLPGLSWPSLVLAACAGAVPATASLLAALAAESSRLPATGATLEVLRELATGTDPEQVGRDLHRLGVYVSDPRAVEDPTRRLADGAAWREKLDAWSAPDKDFERALRSAYEEPDSAAAMRVAGSRGPFGIDYSRFTLDDRPQSKPAGRLRLAQPLRARGAAYAASGRCMAAWLPGGGAVGLALSGVPRRGDSARIRWSTGATQQVDIDGEAREVLVRVPEDGSATGWHFGELVVGSSAPARLAVSVADGDWFPVEAAIDVDSEAGAFVSGEDGRVICLDASSRVIGSAALSAPPTDAQGVAVRLASLGPEARQIPLISTVPADDEQPWEDRDEPGPGNADGDGAVPTDDLLDPQEAAPGGEAGPAPSDDDPELGPVPSGTASCVPLALLDAARRGSQDVALSFAVVDGTGYITAGDLLELQPQTLRAGEVPALDGLQIERYILAHPAQTAFVATATAAATGIARDPGLDRLSLDGLDQDAVTAFQGARAALFDALLPLGSVHALGVGAARLEAERYVATYTALLGTLDPSGPFQAEYERLLLCDAVTDSASGDILLAPTNPVTVSWLLGLTSAVGEWLPQAAEVLPGDLAGLSPRHLLPTFARGNVWHESVAGSPLLWRRYRAQAGTAAGADTQHAYIRRRIEHFLRVYPHYADSRQVLSLAFLEPGEGQAVLAALRGLFSRFLDDAGVHLPRLSVTLVTSSRRESALERVLGGTAPGAASPREAEVERAMRDRVSVRVLPPATSPLPFAHLTFVFRSPLLREPGVVDLAGRSGTLWAGGLAASPGRHVQPGRNETAFAWGTFVGSQPDSDLARVTHATLQLVGGMPRDHLAQGKTRMPSTRVSSAFLTEVYESSVWVVHLDRLLGLEAFAPSASGEQARYLIDYEDRADPAQPGLDAITATARIEPYRLALRRALAGLGDPSDAALDRILRLFNSVSGRWALDVVGANTNDLHERIGLAAAIAACEELDLAFSGEQWCGVVVPLKEVLDSLPQGLRRPAGQHSDDLLYLRLDLGGTAEARISGRLLEVKFRTGTDPAAPATARVQLEVAREWLRRVFCDEGPGRAFRSRDLAELLRGAVTRGESFGLLRVPDRGELERALDLVSAGKHRLDLTFDAGGVTLGGDFISVEADSSIPAHRQPLEGSGTRFGHVRLGRPVLEALATGRPLPRPPGWTPLLMPPPPPPPAAGGAGGGGGAPDPDPAMSPPGGLAAPPADPVAAGAQEGPGAWTEGAEGEVAALAPRLDAAFTRYGLAVEPFDLALVQAGPSLLRFRTRTLGRLSITEVERRARDITREVGATGEVSIGDEPGFITVDVPREQRRSVPLAAVLPALDRAAATGKPGALDFVTGLAPSGEIRISDLSRLPHLLVAGATGSGKSVFLKGLLAALLRGRSPDQLGLLIVDPKRLDFAGFARVPHLRGQRIIHEADEALETLRDTLEMELAWRQPILEGAGVSSASEYYECGGKLEDLPQLVILVDEFADLVLSGSDRKSFSEMIQRYAQLTRAYGIFLVLATQRPSVDVITGSIKANLTARIAFSLPSSRDSMTVLDRPGAQDLLGNGDLLFYSNGRVERLQAPFTSAADVRAAVGG